VLSLHGLIAHYNGKVNGSIDGEVIERAVNHFFKKTTALVDRDPPLLEVWVPIHEHLSGRTIRQPQRGYKMATNADDNRFQYTRLALRTQ
jgi:hypothetical protein